MLYMSIFLYLFLQNVLSLFHMNFDLKTSKIRTGGNLIEHYSNRPTGSSAWFGFHQSVKDRDSEEKTFKTIEFQYFKSPEMRKMAYLNPTFLKYSSFI